MILVTMVSLGLFIEKELSKKGMTQSDLARKSGLDTGWISNLISGVKQLGLISLVKLSIGLNVPTDTILRASGHLPAVSSLKEDRDQLLFLFEGMDPQQRKILLSQAKWIIEEKP